ncbi:MAG: YqeG family HAD IIIA-type phosphatase [Clostridia bacterium]|nr:YqeG family HAD IIIA-type phosphatase [Clostridia bacterium]
MLEKYFPDIIVEKTWDIDLGLLKKSGVKGLILDIDNTLVAPHIKESNQEVFEWIQKVKSEGFKVCIVSNASRKRVLRFNEKLNVFAIHRAYKPGSKAFLKAASIMGINPNESAVIGDQIFTDIIGGNKLNMFTVLVNPIHKSEPLFVKFKRIVERYILARYHRNHNLNKDKRLVWKKKSAVKRIRV